MTGSTIVDGDGGDAAVDRGDAGESDRSPKGATQQFTATGTFSDNTTQNLTSQVTWASATPAVATINAAGLATAVAVGHVDDQRDAGRRDGLDGR